MNLRQEKIEKTISVDEAGMPLADILLALKDYCDTHNNEVTETSECFECMHNNITSDICLFRIQDKYPGAWDKEFITLFCDRLTQFIKKECQ